jgi:hypothetical protein
MLRLRFLTKNKIFKFIRQKNPRYKTFQNSIETFNRAYIQNLLSIFFILCVKLADSHFVQRKFPTGRDGIMAIELYYKFI